MRTIITTIGIIALTFLTACSSPVARYDTNELSTMLQPKPAKAKLVLYYPHAYAWKDKIASVKAAGQSGCRLKDGHFIINDINPGAQSVTVSLCNGNDASTLKFTALAGKRYYVQIIPNDTSVVGLAASADIPSTQGATHVAGGAFDMDLIGEDVATKQILYLKLVQPQQQPTKAPKASHH